MTERPSRRRSQRLTTSYAGVIKAHYIGYSNLTARQLAKSLEVCKANGWASFSSLQAYYSVAGRDIKYDLLPLCREEGLGVLPWSALAGGFLTGKYRREKDDPEGACRTEFDFPPIDKEEVYDAVEVMEEIAEEKGASIPHVELAGAAAPARATAPIIGGEKMSQLEENLASVEVNLSADELSRIAETTEPKSIYPQ